MSAENVEIVRSSTQAFVEGDLETALASLDDQIEWHATVGGIDEGRIAHGVDEVIQAFMDYFEVWERLELRAEEYIDAGGDDVVVFWHEVAKGKESGVVVETDTGSIQTIGGGKIVKVRAYMDRDEALRVAGIGPGGRP